MSQPINAKELIKNLRTAIAEVETAGGSTITVAGLRQYLDGWEKDAEDAPNLSHDLAAYQRSLHLEQYKHQMAANSGASSEMFKSVIEAGLTALRAATLINAGAAAAVLAFIGSILKPGGTAVALVSMTPLGFAWFMYMLGLGFAGTAAGFRYLAQACFSRHFDHQLHEADPSRWGLAGTIFNIVSIALVASAFGLFFWGSWEIAMLLRTLS